MKKVLFICIGNCIRSQMAEGFARTYGRDVMEVYSAGVSPAGYVSEMAFQVMGERGISLSNQYSKALHEAPGAPSVDHAVITFGDFVFDLGARSLK